VSAVSRQVTLHFRFPHTRFLWKLKKKCFKEVEYVITGKVHITKGLVRSDSGAFKSVFTFIVFSSSSVLVTSWDA